MAENMWKATNGPAFLPRAVGVLIGACVMFVSALAPVSAQDFGAVNALAQDVRHEIAARPLFSPTRKPPPAARIVEEIPTIEIATTPAEPNMALEWELIGVIISQQKETVLVRDRGNGEVFRLSVGESWNNWKLEEISGRVAYFANGETRQAVGYISDQDGN